MEYVTPEQMAKVDEIAVNEYNIAILQMMENAGRNFARFVASLKPKKVITLCGKGNNGGDGIAAARHLHTFGIDVEIVLASDDLNESAGKQLETARKMGIREVPDVDAGEGDIIIDALLGYNIRGNPRGRYAELIDAANASKANGARIASFDIPSGIDPHDGKPYKPAISADYTLTLALPKTGLKAAGNVGELHLVNIGIPSELYRELGIEVGNYFAEHDTIRISAPAGTSTVCSC